MMTCVGSADGGTRGDQPRGGGSIPTSTLRFPLTKEMARPVAEVRDFLTSNHYLGPSKRGWAWVSDHGAMVFANPSSRHLPQQRWLELVRWCLNGEKNAGSKQWSLFVRWARIHRPDITTVVSYSDPAVGHTGALYRACNWWWAPTWLRLRPPPTGNGNWGTDAKQSTKDRWVYPLSADEDRIQMMTAQDESILRRWPEARYVEPGGVPFSLLARILGQQSAA